MDEQFSERSNEWLVDDWRAFMNRLPELVPSVDIACLLTPDQRFISLNEEAAEAYGQNSEDVIGRHCYALVHGQDEPIDECPCKETLETGAPVVGDVFEENNRYYRPATAPIYAENGEIQALAHTVSDVTRQQQTLAALERRRQFLNHTQQLGNVGGWELDFDTRNLRLTNGTRELLAVPDEYEPSLDTWLELFHSGDKENIEKSIETCHEQGAVFDLEGRLATGERSNRWVRISGECIEEDGRPIVRGAIRDITELKHREQRLSVLNRILRHNIRNGMNAVKGNGAFLAEAIDDDSLTSHITTIEEQADNLVRISEKAITLEQLFEHPPGDDLTCDVGELLAEPVAELGEKYPQAVITVTGPETVSVRADNRLQEAIREAVENAIVHNDHTQPNVRITVTPADATGSHDWITIEIADTGPRIPETERQMLEPTKETPLSHGTGLGLWFIHWIVTAFDGEMHIRENEPRGNVVTLRLPAADTDGPSD